MVKVRLHVDGNRIGDTIEAYGSARFVHKVEEKDKKVKKVLVRYKGRFGVQVDMVNPKNTRLIVEGFLCVDGQCVGDRQIVYIQLPTMKSHMHEWEIYASVDEEINADVLRLRFPESTNTICCIQLALRRGSDESLARATLMHEALIECNNERARALKVKERALANGHH